MKVKSILPCPLDYHSPVEWLLPCQIGLHWNWCPWTVAPSKSSSVKNRTKLTKCWSLPQPVKVLSLFGFDCYYAHLGRIQIDRWVYDRKSKRGWTHEAWMIRLETEKWQYQLCWFSLITSKDKGSRDLGARIACSTNLDTAEKILPIILQIKPDHFAFFVNTTKVIVIRALILNCSGGFPVEIRHWLIVVRWPLVPDVMCICPLVCSGGRVSKSTKLDELNACR